ncbi:ABC transporter ATP-binding protein [Lactococcus hodotermopsidis]|uniref:ABC transporter ATP-binding protein n=1 Tax=Pseudolactococcus hodotermopsidis TaxID=2709157 RepID=UPI0035312318
MINLENITKSYELASQEFTVLKDVSLEIETGDFVGIMGRSGSGKSTLVNLIGFLDKKFKGNYYFEDKLVEQYTDDELSKIRNENVGFVFQNFGLIEKMTVGQNIELPLVYAGLSPKKRKELILESLEKVGLADFVNQSVKLLSGGQRQRVAIARAIVNTPKFIIADEPTGALDSKTSDEIMQLFSDLNQKSGVTIILVTHDAGLMRFCNREIRVSDGEVML